MTLPSNSSQEFFPEHTLTEFITKLPSTIELTGEWEVGLAEMMFPRTWYTIPKNGLAILVDYRGCDIDWQLDMSGKLMNGEEPPQEDTTVEIILNASYYSSMEELSDELNYATSPAFSRVDSSMESPDFYYKPM